MDLTQVDNDEPDQQGSLTILGKAACRLIVTPAFDQLGLGKLPATIPRLSVCLSVGRMIWLADVLLWFCQR